MRRWGYRGEFWYRAGPPRPVKGGIKARSQRGRIGETWWSGRWVEVLEGLDLGARLGRGRAYARRGQVMNLDVKPGRVSARVQGSRPTPYKVAISLAPLAREQWDRVVDVMASQALFAAKLLAGEMPQDIEQAFRAAKVPLFPAIQGDLETECSCPDWSNPCKHIAAVYLLLAEEFDRDPFMLFLLRGMEKDRLIGALRERWAGDGDAGPPAEQVPTLERAGELAVPPLEGCLDRFWSAGEELDAFRVAIAPPSTPRVTLKRLGPPPFWQGKGSALESLARAYDAATAQALRLAYGDVEENGSR